jgi:TPR repeat protein
MLRLIILAWVGCLSAMVAEAADTPAKTKAPMETSPSSKTEYDKLPLAQLIAKANANDRTAQFELASRHNYGRGLPKNTAEALRWLRKAALGGHLEAARLLAVKLYEGHDVAQDHTEAIRWAQTLAEAGDLPGQLMLANMYASGEGTPRDLVRAYMWYAIAAVGGKNDGDMKMHSVEQVQYAAEQRDRLASLLSEEQEAEAQRLASEWWMHNRTVPKKSGKTAKARAAQ